VIEAPKREPLSKMGPTGKPWTVLVIVVVSKLPPVTVVMSVKVLVDWFAAFGVTVIVDPEMLLVATDEFESLTDHGPV
jgi:hypothetical protein